MWISCGDETRVGDGNVHLTKESLREFRKRNDLSVRELAVQAGISPSTISEFECGKVAHLSDTNAQKLCRAILTLDTDVPPELKVKQLLVQTEAKKLSPSDIIGRAESLLENCEHSSPEYGDLLLLLAEQCIFIYEKLPSAVRYASQAMAACGRVGSKRRWCRSLVSLSMAHYCNGAFMAAIDNAQIAKTELIGLRMTSDELFVKACSIIALSSAALQDRETAKQYAEQCLAYLDSVPDDKKMRYLANDKYVRGDWLLANGHYQDALEIFDEAYKLFRELNDSWSSSQMKNNVAWALAHLGDLESASRLIDETLQSETHGTAIVYACRMKIQVLCKWKRYDEMKALAAELLQRPDLPINIQVDVLKYQARAAKDAGDRNAANEYLKEALTMLAGNAHLKSLYNEIATEWAVLHGLPV